MKGRSREMASTIKKSNQIKNDSKSADFLIGILMAAVIFITLYPLYYVFILSVSDPVEAATMKVFFYPKGIYLRAYEIVLRDKSIWRSFGYTVFYVIAGTLFTIFTSTTTGYVLSSPHLRGRKLVTLFLLVPMYFSGGTIPSFLLISKLGLYNTVWALVFTSSFNIMYMIYVRSYFYSIPEEMRESAKIEGAGNFRIFSNIYLPLAIPVIAVVAIYTIVNIWNSWYHSMVYQPDTGIQPLQMYLRRVLVEQTIDLTKTGSMADMEALARTRLSNSQLKYSMIIITTIPIILVYPFFQKHFVKGVMLGSVKG